jgi:hypothetical protein
VSVSSLRLCLTRALLLRRGAVRVSRLEELSPPACRDSLPLADFTFDAGGHDTLLSFSSGFDDLDDGIRGRDIAYWYRMRVRVPLCLCVSVSLCLCVSVYVCVTPPPWVCCSCSGRLLWCALHLWR